MTYVLPSLVEPLGGLETNLTDVDFANFSNAMAPAAQKILDLGGR